MKIILEIQKEFESDYKGDTFKDFFSRVLCDIENGTLCGNYEKEIANMFLNAFDESKLIDESVNGDLISRQDVMEMLTNIELSCTVIPITEAKLQLRDIPAVSNDGWIPCSGCEDCQHKECEHNGKV